MQTLKPARDCAQAVERFAAGLTAIMPARVCARWDGVDGLARLSAAEAAIADRFSPNTAKELIWATGAGRGQGSVLHLQARGVDGALLGDAAYHVAA